MAEGEVKVETGEGVVKVELRKDPVVKTELQEGVVKVEPRKGQSKVKPRKGQSKVEPGNGHVKVEPEAVQGSELACGRAYEGPLDLSMKLLESMRITATTDGSAKTPPSDKFNPRDWASYIEDAKRLRQAANDEGTMTEKAILYLNAAMYLVLTGMAMERDPFVLNEAIAMYQETFNLIGDIAYGFGNELLKPLEAKIMVLVLRCQAVMCSKLFDIKMCGVKERVWCMHNHFQLYPQPVLVASCHVPSDESDCPPPPPVENALVPVTLFWDLQQMVNTNIELAKAQIFWENANQLVQKDNFEEFFRQLDSQVGTLTLHSPLVVLVRYVNEAVQILQDELEKERVHEQQLNEKKKKPPADPSKRKGRKRRAN